MASKSSLPPLVPLPPTNIRLSIAPAEWEACLEGWLTLTDLYIRLPSKEFSGASSQASSLLNFLGSFHHEKARPDPGDTTLHGPTAHKLQRTCFRLMHRIFLEPHVPQDVFDFELLADFCRVHLRSTALARLMTEFWKRQSESLKDMLQSQNNLMIKLLDGPLNKGTTTALNQLADVMLASPDVAAVFMTGSDFLDALVSHYSKTTSLDQRKAVVATAYFGLLSLVKTEHPNVSLLSDLLYSLKAQADKLDSGSSFLADIVTNTPLIPKLKQSVSGSSAERLVKLLDTLETYRSPSIANSRKHTRRKVNKGKGRAVHSDGDMHMHRMSLVTQVQDLFPDLGSGFVLKLLDEYGDDVEQVTAHLLDDSLPTHLRDLDRAEEAPIFDTSQAAELDHLAPRPTPPLEPYVPERRNVFDDDEFDRLEVDAGRLHVGKKADAPSQGQPNKAAILSALAAFDSDDDERDDTYDVEDVGGTVDTAHPDGEPGPAAKVTQEENDMALFPAYIASPGLFGRTFDVRKGQARQALKAETGMTDETIEGWAIMLQRDPKRLKRLEAQLGSFNGKQTGLARTSYRESPGGTETEDSDGPNGRGGFRGRGRERGRGGRDRGGNVAGPSDDANTAAAQRRKEANKGSRANHNRRDQRARKMARGGFPG